MKKSCIICISIFFLLMSEYYGCNSPTSVAYPPGIINGIVLDSATHLPIDSAIVGTDISGFGAYTDPEGHFRIAYTNMPSSGVNLNLIAGKSGYTSDTTGIWLLSNDSVYIRMILMPSSGVLIVDNITLIQYAGQQSFSSLDLSNMTAIKGLNPYRDVDLRDSFGMGQRFQFKSASLDPILFSFDTKFANSLGSFSKYDFDTLKMIYGLGGPITDSYFQLRETPFFSFPLVENSVYPFYLLGRYLNNQGSSKIYGLLYINSMWFDPGSNSYMIKVDIKENKNGNNYFVNY
jgi:hypothetical protein